MDSIDAIICPRFGILLLMGTLQNAPWPGGVSFDPTTCYKLVRTFDNDWTGTAVLFQSSLPRRYTKFSFFKFTSPSGTITFYEFAALFKFVMCTPLSLPLCRIHNFTLSLSLFDPLTVLHSIFQMADQNRSGTLEPMELQWALQQAGFMVRRTCTRSRSVLVVRERNASSGR